MIIDRTMEWNARTLAVIAAVRDKLAEMGHIVPVPTGTRTNEGRDSSAIPTIDGVETEFYVRHQRWSRGREVNRLIVKYGTGGIREGELRIHREPKEGFDTDKIAKSMSDFFKAKKEAEDEATARQTRLDNHTNQAREVEAAYGHKRIRIWSADENTFCLKVNVKDPDVLARIARRVKDILELEELAGTTI